MKIFIDESGIHKNTDHSTFVLVYIEISDYDLIEKKIIAIEHELGLDNFHWANTVWRAKEKFLEKVLQLNFKVKLSVVRNPVRPDRELEKILNHTIIEKKISQIFIDGKKPRWYELKIKKVLRDKGLSVKKLKTVKADQYAGIRLADAVAGLSRSHFDGKNVKRIEKFYRKLEKKIIVVIN